MLVPFVNGVMGRVVEYRHPGFALNYLDPVGPGKVLRSQDRGWFTFGYNPSG